MSDAHGDHGHDNASSASDHHAHEAFDPEPAQVLDPGEPRTPAWVSFLGAGIFLVGGVYFLVGQTTSSAEPGGQPSASASVTATAVTAPAPAATNAAPPSTNVVRDLSPEQRRQLETMLSARRPGSSASAPAASGSAAASASVTAKTSASAPASASAKSSARPSAAPANPQPRPPVRPTAAQPTGGNPPGI